MFIKLSGRISIFIGIIAAIIAVPVFAQPAQQTEPAPADNRLASPTYDIYERDVVIVEFAATETIRLREGGLQNLNQSRTAAKTDQLEALVVGGVWQRANTLSEAELDNLRQRAEAFSGKTQADLNNRLRLTLPAGMEALEAQSLLTQFPAVAAVYLVPKPVAVPLQIDYSQNTGNNSNNAYQKYLDAAPNGLDARYAWQIPGGDGFGIKICDVEYDYNENHTDINGVTYVGDPADPPFDDNHGTAVLGMVGGSDNGYGVKGIAYRSSLYFAAAKTTTGGYDVGNGVLECAAALDPGDVILIEQQTAGPNYVQANSPSQVGLVPVEWHKPWYDDIKTAIAMGMIVVEAAGNGAQNLDSSTYTTGNGGHHPFESGNDSGAIIVGAAKPPGFGARSAADFSNYGATVDLQGWGGSIVTTGYNNLYDNEGKDLWYTNSFGGTSGASPMVTGAAAIVQAIYKAENGSPATAAQMKQILRDTGTPQTGSKNIGPMPDLRDAINSVSTEEVVSPPVISPDSGTYQMPIQVTISYATGQSSSNTHIRYTLNGSEPTPDSFIYLPDQGDTIYLNYGVTLKAKAFRIGGGESETAEAVYVSSTPKVATPIISPSEGTHSQGTQLILTTSTPGATIRYRTDGRTPSFFYPGTIYTGPVTLDPGNYEIAARGYKDGYYKSDTARAEFSVNEIVLPSPTVYPNGGNFNGSVTVYIGSTVLGADIRYTIDGSTPTANSPQFTEPIYLTESATLKTRIYLDGYTESEVVEKTFNVIQQAAPPTFDPPSGTTATDTLEFELDSVTAGAVIRYTTNGAEPTSYSTEYVGPVTLGHGEHTVKAKSFVNGAIASQSMTAEYVVYDPANQIDPPVVYPEIGNYNGPLTVTITSETEGVFISYTTDGSDPANSGTVLPYNGPFVLEGDDTYHIRTRAFKASATPSSVAGTPPSHRLTVVNPSLGQVETPNIDPPSGTYTNTFTAKITAPDFQQPFRIRGLHITDDGTMPLANRENQQSGAVPQNESVSGSKTIKAVGSQVGWENSEVATAEYILKCETPTLSPTGVYTSVLEVEMSTGTVGAKIYYTTDGSEPTDSSPTYEGLFPINETTTVRAFCTKANFEDSESTTAVYAFEEAVIEPEIEEQPENATVNACDPASFDATATGTEVLSYQWFKDGNIMAGENEPVLEIPAARSVDEGNYLLIVTNVAGAATSQTATLTVNGEDSACNEVAPSIDTQPEAKTVAACSATSMSVVASGSDPLSYQWMKDGSDISGETSSMISFDPATTADGGSYSVKVTNAFGTVTSDSVALTVTGDDSECVDQPPTIDTQPESQTVSACGIATFSASANGSRPFSYQWSKDGSPIPDATDATLTIDPAKKSDEGSYTLMVSNSFGNVTTSAATLTVNGDDAACTEPPTSTTSIYLPFIGR